GSQHVQCEANSWSVYPQKDATLRRTASRPTEVKQPRNGFTTAMASLLTAFSPFLHGVKRTYLTELVTCASQACPTSTSRSRRNFILQKPRRCSSASIPLTPPIPSSSEPQP